ncbi:MAG: hypothetical protein R3F60_20085 [bacterium]
MVRLRGYQLALVRALHTTDDPGCCAGTWPTRTAWMSAPGLMQKSWEALTEGRRGGHLNHLKKKIQLLKLRAAPESGGAAPGRARPRARQVGRGPGVRRGPGLGRGPGS